MATGRERAEEAMTAGPERAEDAPASPSELPNEAPDPIEHATPDVELAQAQMAIERPELPADAAEPIERPRLSDDAPDPILGGRGWPAGAQAADAESGLESSFEYDDDADLEPGLEPGGGGRGGGPARSDSENGGGDSPPGDGGELALPGRALPEGRARAGNRLVNFVQGSWRELQRVQWPDRRQVMQATGVVIGFVIVAGVFLGVADAIAAKVVNFILQ